MRYHHSTSPSRVQLVCPVCGTVFSVVPSHAHRRRYCSYACRDTVKTPRYTVDANNCWVWNGYTTANGYGRMTVQGKQYCAHRWFYEQRYGPVPEDRQLDHICRVRKCVNPDHLEIVTPRENVLRGSHPKLNLSIVRDIRARHGSGLGYRKLARMYGVSVDTIAKVIRGQTWPDP